jgi:hypothetical protein
LVVGGIVGIVPHPGESGFGGLGCGAGELLACAARLQKIDEVLSFRHALGRQCL